MNTKAILLDLDFTLIDASPGIYLCITHALKTMGYPEASYKKCISTIGLSFPDTFESLTNNTDLKESQKFEILFLEKAREVLIENTQVFDTLMPFLNNARAEGYKLAIVTSKYRYALDDILNKFQLNPFFDFHIAGDEVEHPKPHPMSIEKTLKKLNFPLEEAVYVGDSVIDGEAAHRAGIKFIAVLTGPTEKAAFSQYTCTAIIKNLSSLLETIAICNSVLAFEK